MKKAKRSYYRNYFQEISKQSKNIWYKINEILKNKSKQLEDVFLNENDMILTNQVIVSEQFNKYFVTVAQNLVDDAGETANKFQDYLKNLNEHSMLLKEVEPGEIKKIINNLDTKKASDIFHITPKLLKATSDKIIEPFTFLFNETIKKVRFHKN